MREKETRKKNIYPTYVQDKDTGFTFEVIQVETSPSMRGKRQSNIGKYLLTAGIVVALAISVAFMYSAFFGGGKIDDDIKTILIPEVIDMKLTSAIRTLESLGLIVEVENTLDDSKEIDTVVSQSIQPKAEVIPGTKIILRSVIHTEKVFMPDLEGLSSEQAVDILKTLDHEFIIQEILDQRTRQGYVIDSSPSSGTEILPGDVLLIRVSLGKANYSQWTATLPSSVTTSGYIIESKTQYRYRVKQVESTTAIDTHIGWQLLDTKVEYSSWSEWSQVEKTPSDQLEIESRIVAATQTVYGYRRFTYIDKKTNEVVHTWQVVDGVEVKEGSGKWEELPGVKSRLDRVSTYCSDRDENIPCTNSSLINEYAGEWFNETESIIPDPENNRTEYRSREVLRTYTYVLFSEWSPWSDVKVNLDASREVETRLLYRYKTK